MRAINHIPANTFPVEPGGAVRPPAAQTPMQRISALKQGSMENDLEIAVGGDDLLKLFLREIEDDVQASKNQRVPVEKLKTLLPFHTSAKSRLNQEFSSLADMAKPVDREILHGDLVIIKDPLARERVRQALSGIMKLAYRKGRADEETTKAKEKEEPESESEPPLQPNDDKG